MIKYASNPFLATRISFINEIIALYDAVGASIGEVSDGLALDERSGKKIYAGVGYGGSSLPKDSRALKHLACPSGIELELLAAVSAVNDKQRETPVDRLPARFGGDLGGITVGVLGLAFESGTNDVRGAVYLDVISSLVCQGARVRAYDPQALDTAQQSLPADVELVSTPEEAAIGSGALVILTECREMSDADWEWISAQMKPPSSSSTAGILSTPA